MINSIIRTFYNIAREHKLVRQFKYDRLSKGSGIGEENHPLVFRRPNLCWQFNIE